MSESNHVQRYVERMKIHLELRGPRPDTVYTFTCRARRFLARVGKPPTATMTVDVEGSLLDLARRWRKSASKKARGSVRLDGSAGQTPLRPAEPGPIPYLDTGRLWRTHSRYMGGCAKECIDAS
jgi:hypothetical protein